MSDHVREETLNEFIDGTLEAREALEVEEHLEGCSRCAEELARLRALVSAAAALPRDVQPPRDLWPGLSVQLADETGWQPATPSPELRGRTGFSPGWLAAAAALALAVGLTITYAPWRPSPAAGRPAAPAPDLREAEEQFALATQQLFAALEKADGSASPEIRALLREHLRLVDQAIAETIAALEKDPQNAHLGRMLTTMYARKMDLLQATVRLPGRA